MKKINYILSEAKKSFVLAVPLLFSEWLFAFNFFVITWITAQLGKEALAAIALAQSIYFFLMMMISGISAATAILVAQNLGSKNTESIKHIFAQSALLNVILAVIAGLILWNAPYLFAPFFKIDSEEVANLVTITLHAFIWSILPLTLLIMIEKFLIGLHRTRLVLFFTTITIPLSVFANYSLVLGKFGLPKCGMAGFGYGQAISYSVLTIMFVVMSQTMPSLRSYKLFAAFKSLFASRKYFFEIWRIGWPLGAMFSIEVGAIVTFTFLMSLFGTDVLASFQLTRQYLVLALVTLFALTESSAVRVGHAVGQQDRSLVKLCTYVSMGIGTIFMVLLSVFYLSSKDFLLSLDLNLSDSANNNIIFYTKHFLTAIAIMVIFDGIRNITAGALRGLKDSKSNMYSSIIGYWLTGLPLAYLFGKVCGFKGDGLWAGFILGIVLSAVYLLIRFKKLSSKADLQNLIL